ERALQAYETSVRLQPDAYVYANIGTIHFNHHQYARASESYESAVKQAPHEPGFHSNLGDAYGKSGDKTKADNSYRNCVHLAKELLEVNPKDASRLALLGACQARLAQDQEARSSIDQAVAISPQSPEVLAQAAVAYARLGDRKVARGYADRAIKSG